jgi:hypothetical protein
VPISWGAIGARVVSLSGGVSFRLGALVGVDTLLKSRDTMPAEPRAQEGDRDRGQYGMDDDEGDGDHREDETDPA